MSKKQDRQGARTPADVERRLSGPFAEMEQSIKQMDSQIKAELSLKLSRDESGKIIAMINASADEIAIKGNRLTIESSNFELTQDGTVKANAGEIGGCSIVDGVLQIKNANIGEQLTADKINAENMDIKKATIGGWHLGKTKIYLSNNAEDFVETYALYSEEMMTTKRDNNGNEKPYSYRVYLTAEGVYVDGRDSRFENGTPYRVHKTWFDICYQEEANEGE